MASEMSGMWEALFSHLPENPPRLVSGTAIAEYNRFTWAEILRSRSRHE
jgi:hypothetical protein